MNKCNFVEEIIFSNCFHCFECFSLSKTVVPLSGISSFVLKQVIDMLYNGCIMVGVEVKSHIIKAIGILKIENVQVQNPELHSAYLAYYAKLNAAKTNGEIIRFFFCYLSTIFSIINYDSWIGLESGQRSSPTTVPNELLQKSSTSMQPPNAPAKRQRAQSW